MRVKIDTAAVWDGKRREAGSVIEVPSEVWERNSGWMKPTDEEVSAADGSQKPEERSQKSEVRSQKGGKTSDTADGD